MIQINQIPYTQGLFWSVENFSKMWIMCNFFALTLASFWRFRKIKIVYIRNVDFAYENVIAKKVTI